MTYHTWAPTELDADSYISQSLMENLAYNPERIASGDTGAPRIKGTALDNVFGAFTTQAIAHGTSWVIPAGWYMMNVLTVSGAYSYYARLEIYDGSTWRGTSVESVDGLVVSDGVNYRLYAENTLSSGDTVVHYRKLI